MTAPPPFGHDGERVGLGGGAEGAVRCVACRRPVTIGKGRVGPDPPRRHGEHGDPRRVLRGSLNLCQLKPTGPRRSSKPRARRACHLLGLLRLSRSAGESGALASQALKWSVEIGGCALRCLSPPRLWGCRGGPIPNICDVASRDSRIESPLQGSIRIDASNPGRRLSLLPLTPAAPAAASADCALGLLEPRLRRSRRWPQPGPGQQRVDRRRRPWNQLQREAIHEPTADALTPATASRP